MIDKTIFVPQYWDKIFVNNSKLYCKNIVLITTQIYCNDKNYTDNDKLLQIQKLVTNIRQKIPNTFIILVDCIGINKFNKFKNELKNNIDVLLNIKDNIASLLLNSEIKIYCELVQTKYGIDYITKNYYFKNFFKISNDCMLINEFNYNDYDNDYNCFKKDINIINKINYYDCLYKINEQYFNEYTENLNVFYNNIIYTSVENIYEMCDLKYFICNFVSEFKEL